MSRKTQSKNNVILQEHDQLTLDGAPVRYDERYNNLRLIHWDKPANSQSWGYFASYKIGAEWIDSNRALVVTTKKGMENIDFVGMFMTCFTSDLEIESFSRIYSIDYDGRPIEAPSLTHIVSPLIVLHFLGVVSRLKTLRRGYVHHSENLKKVKGHVGLMKNERLNISTHRYDRIFCEYDEYSADIPENRLIKKALLFSRQFLRFMGKSQPSYEAIGSVIDKSLALFKGVSDDVDIKDVKQAKGSKLFKEYAEAVRLAKIVLRYFDFSISKVAQSDGFVVPFELDMSLLYEHYVYGLLRTAYGDKITYQFSGRTGIPDFLYASKSFKAILDTKYIPRIEYYPIDHYIISQLSGYGRDIRILRRLGYASIDETSGFPSVPCVIIYPISTKAGYSGNIFMKTKLSELCKTPEKGVAMFYKIGIPVPTIGNS